MGCRVCVFARAWWMLVVDKSHFDVVNYYVHIKRAPDDRIALNGSDEKKEKEWKKLDSRKTKWNIMLHRVLASCAVCSSVDDYVLEATKRQQTEKIAHINYNISSYLFFRRKLIRSS